MFSFLALSVHPPLHELEQNIDKKTAYQANRTKMSYDSLLALFGTGVATIGIFSLPAVSKFTTRLVRPDAKQDIYEDEDGKATPESMGAFSVKVPKALILLFAATGLPISIALLLLTLHDPAITPESLVLIVAAWVSPGWPHSTLLGTEVVSNPIDRAHYYSKR